MSIFPFDIRSFYRLIVAPDFQYNVLDYIKREIRLVTIKAGSGADPVKCELETVSLDDEPLYKALSYVWGQIENKKTILVNGQKFKVTQNLGIALQYLRHREDDVVYWIDAVCINQSDLDERRDQVRMMMDIYRSANEVVSWLGERDEYTQRAQDFVNALEASRFSPQWMYDVLQSTDAGMVAQYKNFLDLTMCISVIGPRQYWHRLWVIQEMIAARRGCYLIGDFVFDYGTLKWIDKFLLKICEDSQGTLVWSTPGTGYLFIERFVSDGRPQALFGRPSSERFLGEQPPLLTVLATYGDRQSTDSRDRIFSLISISDMSHSDHDGVTIDYRKSPKDVYTGAAQAIIETTSSLDILTHCVGHRNDTCGWSSWAPGWELDSTPIFATEDNITAGCAAFSFQAGSKILSAEALHIGRIIQIAGGCLLSHESTVTELLPVLSSWKDLAFQLLNPSDSDIEAEFMDTIALGQMSVAEELAGILSTRQEARDPTKEPVRVSIKAGLHLGGGQKYFVMKPNIASATAHTPRMGLLFATAREGDDVYWFLGCNGPIIVRKQGAVHIVLGQCYVHNIAKGEAVADFKAGLYKTETIHLR